MRRTKSPSRQLTILFGSFHHLKTRNLPTSCAKHYAALAFISRKISEDLKVTERKPVLVNQQCIVYEFKCSSCDANYIGYTSRHLHVRINEHRYFVSGKHFKEKHQQEPTNIQERFKILLKCQGKLECLIYELLLIKEKRSS